MKLFITNTHIATMESPETVYTITRRWADGRDTQSFSMKHWRHTTQKSSPDYLKALKALFSNEEVENWEDFSDALKDKMKADRYYVQQG